MHKLLKFFIGRRARGTHGTVHVDHGSRPEDDAHVCGVQLVDELCQVRDLGAGCEIIVETLLHMAISNSGAVTRQCGAHLPLAVDVDSADGDVALRVVAKQLHRACQNTASRATKCCVRDAPRLAESSCHRPAISSARAPSQGKGHRRGTRRLRRALGGGGRGGRGGWRERVQGVACLRCSGGRVGVLTVLDVKKWGRPAAQRRAPRRRRWAEARRFRIASNSCCGGRRLLMTCDSRAVFHSVWALWGVWFLCTVTVYGNKRWGELG